MLGNKLLVEAYLNKILFGTICAPLGAINIHSSLTWREAQTSPGYLSAALKYLREHDTAVSLKFEHGDTYLGSIPFTIEIVALLRCGSYLLWVVGQKSPRIDAKWTKKLTRFFGSKVILKWVEEVP